MTTTARHPESASRSSLRAALVGLAVVAIVLGAWGIGSATAPTEADADRARTEAHDTAYADARSDAFDAAYASSWQPAFERGAAAGSRDGATDGAAAARRQLRTASR